MTEIHGRTFGVWTLLTCTLCFLCAFNLDNKPLYLATFLSFIYALGHFATEYFIYHTMAIQNLATVGFFAGYILFSLLMLIHLCLYNFTLFCKFISCLESKWEIYMYRYSCLDSLTWYINIKDWIGWALTALLACRVLSIYLFIYYIDSIY